MLNTVLLFVFGTPYVNNELYLTYSILNTSNNTIFSTSYIEKHFFKLTPPKSLSPPKSRTTIMPNRAMPQRFQHCHARSGVAAEDFGHCDSAATAMPCFIPRVRWRVHGGRSGRLAGPMAMTYRNGTKDSGAWPPACVASATLTALP